MTTLDSNSAQFLDRALRLGRAVLFVGAGFPSEVRNRLGHHLPLGSELKVLLWDLAFPSEPVDPQSSLGDVFDVASRTRPKEAEALLRERLTVDPDTIPDFYRIYLQIPWYRIYSLNFDDLFPAAERKFKTGADLTIVSSLRDMIPTSDLLGVVHLNGTLDDFPRMTFSPPQYGQRAAKPDLAYNMLVRDLASHPVIFVGTQLDEPPLWQHVEMRGERHTDREYRPKSFLVTPSVAVAKAAMLERFNVRHVALKAKEFAENHLASVASDRVARPAAIPRPGDPLVNLDTELRDVASDPADFLLGREPVWSDISTGYAIERTFESDLSEHAREAKNRIVLISGTAGAGKSTTLRRLAMLLHADGNRVGWLRLDAPDTVFQLRAAILASRYDVVIIDRAERFSARGIELLHDVAATDDAPRILAAYSSTSYDELRLTDALRDVAAVDVVVPLLSDADIALLVDALTRANRLGKLAGRTPAQQFGAIKDRAHRQLLVAMLEATSGQRFEDKIDAECQGLAPDLGLAYGVTALATSLHYHLKVDDLLAALQEVTGEGLALLDRLVRQHLVLLDPHRHVAARHPLIARQIVDHYRRSGQIGEAIARLAFVMASKVYPGMPRTRERRLLTTLTSHEYVHQAIGSRTEIQSLYADLEPLLQGDAHYWLQRGSYELEHGDLSVAGVFLDQARGLAGGDFMVMTEWAYLVMERACRNPADIRSKEWFDEGFDIVTDIIDRSGDHSVKTYVVLAQKTVQWTGCGPLTLDERKRLLESVRSLMSNGNLHHAGNRQFGAARKDLEAAYLALSLA